MILDTVTKFVPEEEILFVVSNFGDTSSNSSDTDIYCVTSGQSSIHLFYDENGQWIELFVDNISDLHKKIENIDEIAINFIHELQFVSGDQKLYSDLLAKTSSLREYYHLPGHRKNLLKYRAHVLLSKYRHRDNVSGETQEHFILNALSYPLVQLMFEYHHIFPSSPKRWIAQLEQVLSPNEFGVLRKFLAHECDRETVVALCEKYAGAPEPMHSQKKDNGLTFLS